MQLGGSVIGRYRLVSVLGMGGMGAVYRAFDERLRREVALKQVVLPVDADDETRGHLSARLEREARAVAALKHPNVVTIFDQVTDAEGTAWIVMELVAGGSLDDRLAASKALPVAEVARIGAAVARALRAAHGAGVVHRDLKPANILLEADRVVVTDFGIASVDGDVRLTRSGALLGTPAFMSPEQIVSEAVGPATDVWSLGATLYNAVEGRPPFKADSLGGLYIAIHQGTPEPFEVAGPLAPTLSRMLVKDPTARAGLDEVIRSLDALAAAGPVVVPDTDGPAPRGRPAPIAATDTPTTVAVTVLPLAETVPPMAERDPVAEDVSPPADGPVAVDAVRSTAPLNALVQPRRVSRRAVLLAAAGVAVAGGTAWYLTHNASPADGHTARTPGSGASSPGPSKVGPSTAPAQVTLDTVTTIDASRMYQLPEAFAFSADGGRFATGGKASYPASSADFTARVWDARTGKLITTARTPYPAGQLRPPGASCEASAWVKLSPDGSHLITADGDGSTRVLDVARNRVLATLTTWPHPQAAGFAYSPDGTVIAAVIATPKPGRNGSRQIEDNTYTVNVWRTSDYQRVATLTRFTGPPALAFSPGGGQLFTGDTVVKIWNVASWQLTATLPAPRQPIGCLALSPDATTVATGGAFYTPRGNHTPDVTIWDANRGTLSVTYTGYSEIDALAFSADGRTVIASGLPNFPGDDSLLSATLRAIDVTDGRLLSWAGLRIDGTDGRAFALSPDGRTALFVGSYLAVATFPY